MESISSVLGIGLKKSMSGVRILATDHAIAAIVEKPRGWYADRKPLRDPFRAYQIGRTVPAFHKEFVSKGST
jgi:hypothetical protein